MFNIIAQLVSISPYLVKSKYVFVGPNTLTNFIQSRGRARKPGSKFYVFVDSEYTKSTQDLENQESILKHLIHEEGTRDRLPSEKSKQVIEYLKKKIPAKVYGDIPKKPVEEGREFMLHTLYVNTVFRMCFNICYEI